MRISDFNYELPKELIAQEPVARRDEARLLVLSKEGVEHRRFTDLPGYLAAGDVVVVNDSRVVPARLRGRRATGGRVELLLLSFGSGGAEALVRSKPLREGERIRVPGGEARVVRRVAGSRYLLLFDVRSSACTPSDLRPYLERHGEMPTPPYIKKRLEEPERYQTVYAREPGSVAAPTAGLHFTPEVLEGLRRRGVAVAPITLHIGPGTFSPVRASEVEEHRMEAEYYRIPQSSAEAISGRRGRLLAVGTTVVRALESAALQSPGLPDPRPGSSCLEGGCAPAHSGSAPGDLRREPSTILPSEGWTGLFIRPGHEFRLRPELLLTNFHLPRSTPLLLVSALVGRERLLAAYEEAVREKYRFYSFGDAMLCRL
ncbi:MAG: S-adenosylmethionine:tRNA ribosyltransferase-isomerase [Thermoplasmatota archaeon]